MNLSERLKLLRRDIGLSQDAMGTQRFISAPGWGKIENGQRQPSDEVLHRLIGWLLKNKYVGTSAASELLEELLTLKYLASRSSFVRKLAQKHARQLFADTVILVSEELAVYRVRPRHKRR